MSTTASAGRGAAETPPGRRLKLKSGTTLWAHQNRPPPRYPLLKKDVACDVAVIGAGITGALVAHELVRRGLDVAVLDRRTAAAGSTSASTALLLYETDTSLAELSRRHGRAAAVRAYRLGRRALREIVGIVRGLHLDCDYRTKKSLYLASDREGVRDLRTELRLRRASGLPGTWVTRHQLLARFGLDYPAAIYSPGCGQVDAMRFAQQLLAHHHQRHGLRIFQKTRVTALRETDQGVTLKTAAGAVVRARHVVVATGYEAAPFLRDENVRLHSSYVVASEPIPGGPWWKDRCLMWETARPYFYLRGTEDGRVLIGGEDEPFATPHRRDAKLPAKAKLLEARLRELFPDLPYRRAFAWTGTFAESADGLPYIGPREPGSRVFYALGYGGNGITFSQIAARILGQLCVGRPHRDAALFRFGR